MPEQSLTIETILNKLSKKILNQDQVCEILNSPTEFPTRLIEELSIATALKYWHGQIDYGDGDCVMNNLYGFWMSDERYYKNHSFSGIAWECYLAFDSGEFFRDSDDRSIDPSEKYTRPLVETLLRKLELIV